MSNEIEHPKGFDALSIPMQFGVATAIGSLSIVSFTSIFMIAGAWWLFAVITCLLLGGTVFGFRKAEENQKHKEEEKRGRRY